MEALLTTNWLQRCRTRFFCFQCAAPMCAHCCSADHRGRHHGPGPDPVRIQIVRGAPAMRWQDTRGCGYYLDDVQRLRQDGELWIPISPQQQQDLRLKDFCLNCDKTVRLAKDFCCVSCRVEILNSNGTDMAEGLIQFAGELDERIIALNRFCMICFRAFSSQCCPDHTVHHNGPGAAAAAAQALLIIQNIDGWPSVDGAQLPDNFVQNVQAIEDADGHLWYPIHNRVMEGHIANHADQEGHACQGNNCPEIIDAADIAFCSLLCGHVI